MSGFQVRFHPARQGRGWGGRAALKMKLSQFPLARLDCPQLILRLPEFSSHETQQDLAFEAQLRPGGPHDIWENLASSVGKTCRSALGLLCCWFCLAAHSARLRPTGPIRPTYRPESEPLRAKACLAAHTEPRVRLRRQEWSELTGRISVKRWNRTRISCSSLRRNWTMRSAALPRTRLPRPVEESCRDRKAGAQSAGEDDRVRARRRDLTAPSHSDQSTAPVTVARPCFNARKPWLRPGSSE